MDKEKKQIRQIKITDNSIELKSETVYFKNISSIKIQKNEEIDHKKYVMQKSLIFCSIIIGILIMIFLNIIVGMVALILNIYFSLSKIATTKTKYDLIVNTGATDLIILSLYDKKEINLIYMSIKNKIKGE